MSAALLAALLALCPPPAALRRRIDAHALEIASAADEALARYGVPPAVILSVAFLETHLGADRGESGGWGAPRDRAHRHLAGGPMHAARALATSYRVCGSWRRAIARWRCGLCACPRLRGYEPSYAARMIERVHARAGVPLPASF